MASIFDSIRIKKPKRSNFDLSFDVKTTATFGKLTPILCKEVLPGDSFKVNSNVFCRVAPMVAPMMQQVDVYTHYFFVPCRLLWDKWEDFITGGEDGRQQPELPYATLYDICHNNDKGNTNDRTYWQKGTLADYFGLPIDVDLDKNKAANLRVNMLPFRAYQLIYNEWYRDQNLSTKIPLLKDRGGRFLYHNEPNKWATMQVRYRAWHHDYFTSALPWSQRGGEVMLPFEDSLLYKDPSTSPVTGFQSAKTKYEGVDSWVDEQGNQISKERYSLATSTNDPLEIKTFGPTINEVRRSFKVQQWLENSARAGSRYIEQLLSHFGVTSSDARLDRPELLGGGKSPIMVSEVVGTGGYEDASGNYVPQGEMTGHGVSAHASHGFKRYFEEHVYIIGIMSILPRASYMQGLDKMWTRQDKFDFAWPEFSNLGEQPILYKELDAAHAYLENQANEAFGYIPRYAEYKYSSSSVHGEFRDTMLDWHLARKFSSLPKLNEEFITCGSTSSQKEGLNRPFAYEGQGDQFWVQIFHNIHAKRPLPYYGTPQM